MVVADHVGGKPRDLASPMKGTPQHDARQPSSDGLIFRHKEPVKLDSPFAQCAGHSRVFLVPQVEGAQWELGVVGNAAWTAVPLRTLLERACLEEDTCEVVLEYADQGTPTDTHSGCIRTLERGTSSLFGIDR
jgi:hypothetical protein